MHEEGDSNIELAIGTLDNPNAIPPMTKQEGVESRVAWFVKMHSLPEEITETTRVPGDLLKLKTLQHPDHD
jgi:hypothetical protein